MARQPARSISRERAREIADHYFDLDRSATAPAPEEEAPAPEADRKRKRTPARRSPLARAPAEPEPIITDKQARFIDEYCVDFNATQAALRSGYSEKTAAVQGYENLRKPHIARAVEQRLKALASKAGVDANTVLQRLVEELNADIADIFDDHGALKPIHDWPLVFRRGLVAGIDVEHTMHMGDDGEINSGNVVKIKLSDRTRLLKMLGDHVAVQAWKERKTAEDPKATLLGQLAQQLTGTGLRPREIEGTARPSDGA